MGDMISSEAAWQEEELSKTTLPDKRLARRLRSCWTRCQLFRASQFRWLRLLGGYEGGLPLL